MFIGSFVSVFSFGAKRNVIVNNSDRIDYTFEKKLTIRICFCVFIDEIIILLERLCAVKNKTEINLKIS